MGIRQFEFVTKTQFLWFLILNVQKKRGHDRKIANANFFCAPEMLEIVLNPTHQQDLLTKLLTLIKDLNNANCLKKSIYVRIQEK